MPLLFTLSSAKGRHLVIQMSNLTVLRMIDDVARIRRIEPS
jgi:hypothetical protein